MLKISTLMYLIAAALAITTAFKDVCCAIADDEALRDFRKLSEKFVADVVGIIQCDQFVRGMVSPISVQLALALIADGAKGRTESELRKGLKIPNKETTRTAVKALVPLLNKSNGSFSLTFANKLYLKKDYKINEDFKKVATSVYHTEVENIDFSAKAKAANQINSWVASKTNNKIKPVIKEKHLNVNTRLVLVNIMYLNGKWETPFPAQLTKKDPFRFINNETREIDTMHSAPNARYLFFHCGFLKAKFLEIPYKDSTVSMTFILPDSKSNTALEADFEEYLKPHNLTLQRVAVSLPKYVAETHRDFKEILGKLGVTRAFNSVEADLSGISREKNLYVDFVQQRTFLNITESGTEAAVVTADGVAAIDPRIALPPPSEEFIANRPFFLFVRESKSNAIIFLSHFR